MRSVIAAVAANVEGLGWDGEPLEISLGCWWLVEGPPHDGGVVGTLTSLGDVALASGRQTDHDHADLGVLDLDADAVGSRRHGGRWFVGVVM